MQPTRISDYEWFLDNKRGDVEVVNVGGLCTVSSSRTKSRKILQELPIIIWEE